IRLKDSAPFAFAGLWEYWKGEDPAIESCTIITTEPNDVLRPLHDRMPVILEPGDYEKWIDSGPKDPGILQELLRPYPAEEMVEIPVRTIVNNARHEQADCVTPL